MKEKPIQARIQQAQLMRRFMQLSICGSSVASQMNPNVGPNRTPSIPTSPATAMSANQSPQHAGSSHLRS